MAIYSLNLGFISRSEGRSSVGFSAYISGTRHTDARTGQSYSYAHRGDVAVSKILAPEGAPEWALNPATLWNHVETFEDEIAELRFRPDPKNPEKTQKTLAFKEKFLGSAQTAQTVMGAIPLELSREQAEACVEEFLKTRFVTRNLIVHYAIHWDSGNPHFHALVTRRAFVNGAFAARKDHEIVNREEHKLTRKMWEVVANKHLVLTEHDERIDCRSHKDRGSLFEAGFHEGFWAQRLAERGEYSRIVESNEAVRQRNIEILCENPEALIHEVSQKRTTFTKQHLEDEIIRRVGGDEKLFGILKAKIEGLSNPQDYAPNENFASDVRQAAQKLVEKLFKNSELVASVDENINRDQIFTSTAYKAQEGKITQLADTLHARTSKPLDFKKIQEALQESEKTSGFALSEEQQNAVTYLCTGPDIRVLNGRAGTGKTTLLKVVARAYRAAGYNVLGTSFQGKAVEIMEREIGIPCKTLDSLKFAWERHDYQKALVESGRLWGKPYLYAHQKLQELEKSRFTPKNVILVDEANMIAGSLWESFLEEAASKGTKVLIIQDTAQIKSREPGDYGRLFAERFGTALTKEVMRQKVEWQKECSALLNDGRIFDGLKPYQEKGHIGWHESNGNMRDALVEQYLQDLQDNPTHTRIALAYRNKDVDALNQRIRGELKNWGVLGASFSVMTQEFSVGDRVRFTQNDHHGRFVHNTHDSWLKTIREYVMPTGPQGVKNGTFGTILEGTSRSVKVCLDDGRCMKFDPREYGHLTHGYALGIHKSEGSTFDRSFVQLDPLLDSSTLLVVMTRHRYDTRAFASREEIVDFKAFVDRVGRGSSREILQDYQVSETQKPYLERIQQYKALMVEAAALREEMEGSLDAAKSFYKHPSYKGYVACLEQKKEIAKEVLGNWDSHLPFVRLAGLRRDILEVEVGLRSRTLSDLEHRASLQVQGYMEGVLEARELWNSISATHPPVLVKNHPQYMDYQKLRIERDSLAFLFQENPKLYLPFFRVEKGNDGVFRDFWGAEVSKGKRIFTSSLKQQAETHKKSQREKAFEERLPADEKGFYKTTKMYVDATREAASLYHLLKAPLKENSLPREVTSGFFREACVTRDKAAFEIVASLEDHKPFLDAFKFKVEESKLLVHASRGGLRLKVKDYLRTHAIKERAQQAEEFLKIFQEKSSTLRTLCQQEGMELLRLKFDVALNAQVQAGEVMKDVSANALYHPIQNYLRATQEIAKAWKEDTQKQRPETWEQTVQARHMLAQHLMDNAPALSVFKAMYPEWVAKLELHAGKVTPEKNNAQSVEKPFLRAQEVLECSRGRIQELAHDLLGPHNVHRSSNNCLRYGNSGKIAVHIRGSQEGLWHDFSTGEGGDIFKLVQREKGLSFKEAVGYCGWFFGAQPECAVKTHTVMKEKTPERPFERYIQADIRDTDSRLHAVHILYEKSKSIEGTVAEVYLREIRGIQGALGDDLCFLSKGISFTYMEKRKYLPTMLLRPLGEIREETFRLCKSQNSTKTERAPWIKTARSLPRSNMVYQRGRL